jgi:hypothetical protein
MAQGIDHARTFLDEMLISVDQSNTYPVVDPPGGRGVNTRSHLKIVFGSEPEEFFGQPRRETRA